MLSHIVIMINLYGQACLKGVKLLQICPLNMSIFLQRYLAEKISLQKMAGSMSRLSSVLAKSTIDLNPHQIYAALYAFNSPLSRGAILADEVGLGKTIEAGIIVARLYAEG